MELLELLLRAAGTSGGKQTHLSQILQCLADRCVRVSFIANFARISKHVLHARTKGDRHAETKREKEIGGGTEWGQDENKASISSLSPTHTHTQNRKDLV